MSADAEPSGADGSAAADLLQTYGARLQATIESLQDQAGRLEASAAEYAQLERTLAEYPQQLTRSVMIPVGTRALVPGTVRSTNAVSVFLGDKLFADQSAFQASQHAGSRANALAESAKKMREQVAALQERQTKLDVAEEPEAMYNEEGMPFMDIREDLDEDGNVLDAQVVPQRSTGLEKMAAEHLERIRKAAEGARAIAEAGSSSATDVAAETGTEAVAEGEAAETAANATAAGAAVAAAVAAVTAATAPGSAPAKETPVSGPSRPHVQGQIVRADSLRLSIKTDKPAPAPEPSPRPKKARPSAKTVRFASEHEASYFDNKLPPRAVGKAAGSASDKDLTKQMLEIEQIAREMDEPADDEEEEEEELEFEITDEMLSWDLRGDEDEDSWEDSDDDGEEDEDEYGRTRGSLFPVSVQQRLRTREAWVKAEAEAEPAEPTKSLASPGAKPEPVRMASPAESFSLEGFRSEIIDPTTGEPIGNGIQLPPEPDSPPESPTIESKQPLLSETVMERKGPAKPILKPTPKKESLFKASRNDSNRPRPSMRPVIGKLPMVKNAAERSVTASVVERPPVIASVAERSPSAVAGRSTASSAVVERPATTDVVERATTTNVVERPSTNVVERPSTTADVIERPPTTTNVVERAPTNSAIVERPRRKTPTAPGRATAAARHAASKSDKGKARAGDFHSEILTIAEAAASAAVAKPSTSTATPTAPADEDDDEDSKRPILSESVFERPFKPTATPRNLTAAPTDGL
ncbi:uncharacterized protein V1510DRAFT_318534 [Dipodascopsis tothii]|uniref:uncharacterized protein n=1 Tax=Dipodascopsis tothii TaxID=44089 RepID=UPI0034CDB067